MEWFESWFNTPYYHALYASRSTNEASHFIQKLIPFLALKKNAKMLDVACGKGRHAYNIHQMGYDVCAFDLSVESIAEAKKLEEPGLQFFVHDMRHLFYTNYFDCAFNLFTSFGYFNNERGNINTLNAIHAALKPKGKLVIDFLNAVKVERGLSLSPEYKEVDGITYLLQKKIIDKKIIKEIRFSDKGRDFFYTEQVQLLTLFDFERLLQQCGFNILSTFGSYNLEPFTLESDRLIIFAEKAQWTQLNTSY